MWMFRRPSPYLHQKLARPLPTTDRGNLRTVLDAQEYMLSLLKRRELRGQWQRACANDAGGQQRPLDFKIIQLLRQQPIKMLWAGGRRGGCGTLGALSNETNGAPHVAIF